MKTYYYDEYRPDNGRSKKSNYRGINFKSPGSVNELGYFECAHCHMMIATHPMISGVNHRNHCPFCLWSKHVDLYQSGDRLAACKSQMKPVGLSLKRVKNKYADGPSGELMLVHFCVECESLSINRTAADDCQNLLITIFESSWQMDEKVYQKINSSDIHLLGKGDQNLVETRLFGMQNRTYQN